MQRNKVLDYNYLRKNCPLWTRFLNGMALQYIPQISYAHDATKKRKL
jgi:hypothetical protein